MLLSSVMPESFAAKAFARSAPALLLLAVAPAFAQTPVGGATFIQNEVLGHTGGAIGRISRGDQVFRDQLVQTARESRAKIVFLDTTNMAIGPESIVKLDEFAYNGNGTASRVTVNAAKGAFRFISGNSPSNAYQVKTPQAVIGVRGTTYDVRVANGQTYIKLQEGAVTACTASRSQCRDLNTPGESLIVNDNSIEGPFPPGSGGWDFGSLCGGGASDLCNRTTRFAGGPPPPPPGGGFTPPPPRQYASLPPPPPPGINIAPPVRVIEPLPPVVLPPVIRPPRPPRVDVFPPRPRPWPETRPPGGRPPEGKPPGTKPPAGKPPCGIGYSRQCGPNAGRPDRKPPKYPPQTRPPRQDLGKLRPDRVRPGMNRIPRQAMPRVQQQRYGSRQGLRQGPRFGANLPSQRFAQPRFQTSRMQAQRTFQPRMGGSFGGSRMRGRR